ncbi:MAG: hypothetical protein HQ542_06490 [Bacteroidia bacterium]|nr:hypothetical protein [Bacteroidia bacterium]
MKTLSIIILTCLAGLCLTSCKPLLINLSGLKQPKLESVTSVSDYLKKNHVDKYDSLYVCRDSAALYKLMSRVKNFPATLLFDKNGISVQQSDSGYCPGKVEEFMKTLVLSSSINFDHRFSKQEIFHWISPVEGNSETNEEPDFTLFVFWAKYCGSLNNGVFRVMKATQENQNIKAQINLINIDFIDTWNMKSKPKFNYN